jgi:hypothetical protein
MSRTIRRLAVTRRTVHDGKWYVGRWHESDINILKKPCPPAQVQGWYKTRTVPSEECVETFITDIPMPPYCIPGSQDWSSEYYVMLWDRWYAKYGPKLNQYDGWDTVGSHGERWGSNRTHTQIRAYNYVPSTREEKYWVSNPDYNSELQHERWKWLAVHHEVYRNGTCRRQRINGTRRTKQLLRRERRLESQRVLARELDDYYRCLETADRG